MNAVTTYRGRLGVGPACEALGVARSSYYRRLGPKASPVKRPRPGRALTESEREGVLDLMNNEEFRDQPPRQIWATLLDRGAYLAHWRTMYRILTENNQVKERRNQIRHVVYEKPELLATGPNELWSWDITKLRGAQKWTWYSLYVIMDVFSRIWRFSIAYRGLDDREPRARGTRKRAHRNNVPAPGGRAEPAYDPRRPRLVDDVENTGSADGRPGNRKIAFEAARIE